MASHLRRRNIHIHNREKMKSYEQPTFAEIVTSTVEIRNGCLQKASQNRYFCGKLLSLVQMEFTIVFMSTYLCMLHGRTIMNTHEIL